MLLLIGSGVVIALSLWCVAAQVAEYRGLSGIDSAVFAYVAIALARDARAANRYSLVGLVGLLLAGFGAKMVYELATGNTLFVDSDRGRFTPLPLVHLVGAAVGLVLAAINGRRQASTDAESSVCDECEKRHDPVGANRQSNILMLEFSCNMPIKNKCRAQVHSVRKNGPTASTGGVRSPRRSLSGISGRRMPWRRRVRWRLR